MYARKILFNYVVFLEKRKLQYNMSKSKAKNIVKKTRLSVDLPSDLHSLLKAYAIQKTVEAGEFVTIAEAIIPALEKLVGIKDVRN